MIKLILSIFSFLTLSCSLAQSDLEIALDTTFESKNIDWPFIKKSFDKQLKRWGMQFDEADSGRTYHQFFANFEEIYQPIIQSKKTTKIYDQLSTLGGYHHVGEIDISSSMLNIWWADIYRNHKSKLKIHKLRGERYTPISKMTVRALDGRIHFVDLARIISYIRPISLFNTPEYQKLLIGIFYPFLIDHESHKTELKVFSELDERLQPYFSEIDWEDYQSTWFKSIDTVIVPEGRDTLDSGQKLRLLLKVGSKKGIIPIPKNENLEKVFRNDSLIGDYSPYARALDNLISPIYQKYEHSLPRMHPLWGLNAINKDIVKLKNYIIPVQVLGPGLRAAFSEYDLRNDTYQKILVLYLLNYEYGLTNDYLEQKERKRLEKERMKLQEEPINEYPDEIKKK